jgi:hypothetical protein
MQFVDFRTGETSERIATLFPGWERGETVAFLSPHDDDVALGAGFLVREALGAFVSQAAIMENTAARERESRRGPEGYLELYQRAGVRKPIDYAAYFERIRKSGLRRGA